MKVTKSVPSRCVTEVFRESHRGTPWIPLLNHQELLHELRTISHHISEEGAIGPGGWRSKLIRCSASVNTTSFLEMPIESGIIGTPNEKFGEFGFIFQEGNAPAHTGAFEILAEQCAMFNWPAKRIQSNRTDLGIHQKRLRERRFTDEDDLFAAIQAGWEVMDHDMAAKLVSSFHARCTVCARHNGECLNRHWAEVHRIHREQEALSEAELGDNVVSALLLED
jgi:hypothetical protein